MADGGTLIGSQFGHDLRQAREARFRSLAWLSAETKVSLSQLQALEQGQFEMLPGGVFRRGIVKAYLHAVGLEEQEWMRRFQQILDTHSGAPQPALTDEAWEQFAENVRRGRLTGRKTTGSRWLGVLALLVIVLLAAWAVWRFEIRAGLNPSGPRAAQLTSQSPKSPR